MSPSFSRHELWDRQKCSERSLKFQAWVLIDLIRQELEWTSTHLQHVRVPTNGVTAVAIVFALSIEAKIVRWRNKEGLQQSFFTGDAKNLRCYVDKTSDNWHRPSEAKQTVQMESSYFSGVTFIVAPVEVVGQSLLITREPHRLHHGRDAAGKFEC